jgi:hypothetical protein
MRPFSGVDPIGLEGRQALGQSSIVARARLLRSEGLAGRNDCASVSTTAEKGSSQLSSPGKSGA